MKTGLTNIKYDGNKHFDSTENFVSVVKDGAEKSFSTMLAVPNSVEDMLVFTLSWRNVTTGSTLDLLALSSNHQCTVGYFN